MVTSSAMIGRGSEFGRDRVQQLGVCFRVYLAPQNFLRALHGQRGDLRTQYFFGAEYFSVDLRLGPGDNAVALELGLSLRLFHQLRRPSVRLSQELLCLTARFAQDIGGALTRLFEILTPALSRGQPLGDLFLTRLDRPQQRWPDEPGRKPDEDRERRGLREKRQIDVHGYSLTAAIPDYCGITASSGLPNANNIARPTPMMKEASIRPSSRNTLPCSCGMSSGWRAAPSRNRLHMMPTPMHAPAAPSPMMRPIPMPVYAWIIARNCSLSTFSPFTSSCGLESSVTSQWLSCAKAT